MLTRHCDHLAICTNIESLHYTPETNITYANYTSIKRKKIKFYHLLH